MRTTILLSISVLACVSCSDFDYYADGTAKIERAHFRTFGGSSALDTAGGTRLTQNHNKSAGQFFQTVGTVAAGAFGAAATQSNNALTATQNTNATKQAVNASNNATKISIGKQTPIITTPPQQVQFPP